MPLQTFHQVYGSFNCTECFIISGTIDRGWNEENLKNSTITNHSSLSLLTCYDPQLFSFDSWCRIKSIVSTIPKRQEQRNGWRKNKALETRANWRGAFDRGNFLADPCQRRFVLRSPSDCPRGDICARCSKFREFVRVEWWRLISRIWAKPSGVVAKNWHYFLIRSADTFLYLLKRLILRLDHLSSCWIFINPEILRKISANES